MTKKLQFNDIETYRRARGENQSAFWKRFGVTQSGGSRYETGRGIPAPASLLLVLFDQGKITEADLESAMKVVKKVKQAK